jgi:beta-mannosidase
LTNETLAPVAEEIVVRLATFSGEVLHEERPAIEVPANASRAVAAWTAADLDGRPDRYLAVRSPGGRFPANRHFFAPIKDLVRTAAAPAVEIAPAGEGRLRVELTGRAGAYDLLVHLAVPHEATRYGDNFFDLGPGERRSIEVTNERVPLTPAMVRVGWR